MGKTKQRSTANWLKFTKSFSAFRKTKPKQQIQRPKPQIKHTKEKKTPLDTLFFCYYEEELKPQRYKPDLKKKEKKKKKRRNLNMFSYLTESKAKKPR